MFGCLQLVQFHQFSLLQLHSFHNNHFQITRVCSTFMFSWLVQSNATRNQKWMKEG